jgi:ATP:cob(I)alamin adenosyltransferase
MDEAKASRETSLATGRRVRKDSVRIDVIGILDELNALLGLARSVTREDALQGSLAELQGFMGLLMAELSFDDGSRLFITEQHLEILAERIETYEERIPAFTGFVLPGDDPASALLHVARTVARRAERGLVRLDSEEGVRDELLAFINGTSTYCFALARFVAE